VGNGVECQDRSQRAVDVFLEPAQQDAGLASLSLHQGDMGRGDTENDRLGNGTEKGKA
jgi:hypothetical protein